MPRSTIVFGGLHLLLLLNVYNLEVVIPPELNNFPVLEDQPSQHDSHDKTDREWDEYVTKVVPSWRMVQVQDLVSELSAICVILDGYFKPQTMGQAWVNIVQADGLRLTGIEPLLVSGLRLGVGVGPDFQGVNLLPRVAVTEVKLEEGRVCGMVHDQGPALVLDLALTII